MEVASVKDTPDNYWACGLRRGIVEDFSMYSNSAVIVKFLDHKDRDWIGASHTCELRHLIPFHPNHINQSLNDSLVALFED
jgi:hypothetical protein